MGYLFYHYRKCQKAATTVRPTDNNQKISESDLITEKQLKNVKIIKAILLEVRNYSCCLSFSVYLEISLDTCTKKCPTKKLQWPITITSK